MIDGDRLGYDECLENLPFIRSVKFRSAFSASPSRQGLARKRTAPPPPNFTYAVVSCLGSWYLSLAHNLQTLFSTSQLFCQECSLTSPRCYVLCIVMLATSIWQGRIVRCTVFRHVNKTFLQDRMYQNQYKTRWNSADCSTVMPPPAVTLTLQKGLVYMPENCIFYSSTLPNRSRKNNITEYPTTSRRKWKFLVK